MPRNDIDTLAALIREIDGRHTLGAGALASLLIDAGVRVPQETCIAQWDSATVCALPPEHTGWHASNPSWTPEDGVQAGQTWTPQYADSDFRTVR